MVALNQKLGTKIVNILILFFFVALAAISMTLYISWQLEGAGAAINDAGSERMRSYRMAYLLSRSIHDDTDNAEVKVKIREEIRLFESTLHALEEGNPARPLFLPKEREVQQQMKLLHEKWMNRMKPLILQILDSDKITGQSILMTSYHPALLNFVSTTNDLVLMVERSNSRNTALLRSFQIGLVVLALIGTILLIYLFFLMVIRPVERLQDGIQRMAAADFSVRLPVKSKDEFGALADGFNQMADRLENLYSTLEQRVEEKTSSLEEKNQELAILYELTAFLNKPASVEDLCGGILRKLMGILAAQGGLVRLDAPNSNKLHIVIHEGMSEKFTQEENCLSLGECLCGESALSGTPISWDLNAKTERPLLYRCKNEGFQSVSAIPIRSKKQVLGIFNLFFYEPRVFNSQETRLLETIGQHLGVAIENQRLVSREKEMAVSEERNLIAQELHDSIAQSLAFLNIQVQMLAESLQQGNVTEAMDGLGQIREGVQESYDDVRELLVHFRTRVGNADLASAITSALEKFEGQTGIKTAFSKSSSGSPLAPEYVIQLLHIIQEALSNVRKHAQATRVDVEMAQNEECHIIVTDNGKGFDLGPKSGIDSEQHVGIKIMKERAHRIGAQLTITSTLGKGTCVSLTLVKQPKVTAA
ncbi:MAG: type IV pili methyl-accepting chemotaxis transducer N-terminal domain-containing protein [Betaproteobacteria bacterium]|nr:type IV pili methyl-accepting chemotaxis transducer N-terminal domain-containing protein [Betaproteobacteria bacterium]